MPAPPNPQDNPPDIEVQVLKKFDRESNIREFMGNRRKIVSLLLVCFTLFSVYINLIASLPTQVHRASFIGAIVFIAFLVFPERKKNCKHMDIIPFYDYIFAVLGAGAFFYNVYFFEDLITRSGAFTTLDIVMGIIGILALFEVCRRAVGIPILVVVLCFILYAYFGNYIPGYFGHRGFSLERIVSHLYYTTEGIIGTPLGVCSTFIFLFILFGAFLEKTGIGKFFIDIANSIAGWSTGGPAKVAIISSALQGTITGSSVANTVGSGSFTIPMMKKVGYKPPFAAAVEATASTGGQLMPPVMGAAAFLMAEMTLIPYSTIVVAAIIPSLLYFIGVGLMVHLEAKKLGLKGLKRSEIPKFFTLMKRKGHLLIPLVALLVLLLGGATPSRSAAWAILLAIVVSMFQKDTRMTPKTFYQALENGGKNILGVGIACAVAGIIVGIVTLTGVGIKLAGGLLEMSGGVMLIALFFTMIASIILGMGLPTTANYVIMATITAPLVVNLGVPVLAAHMFVFYFGIVADITPPVALAAYAASAIARCNPLKAGVTASKLAITAFLIPYIFAMHPSMLLIDTTPGEVAFIVFSALLGMSGIATCMEGYMFYPMNPGERLMCLVGGLLMLIPGLYTDAIGLVLIGSIFIIQLHKTRKNKKLGGPNGELTC